MRILKNNTDRHRSNLKVRLLHGISVASNNGVTLAEAKRILNAKELAELKWDVNQYIQYGQENAINGTWVKQLENASARFHISRLEALKLQTQQKH